MKIDVLTFEGCPTGEATLALVARAVADEGVSAVVNRVEVNDEETARALRFLGSPSVQVNGRDIEKTRRADPNYGLTCRIYQTPDGASGMPPAEMVRAALRSACAGEG